MLSRALSLFCGLLPWALHACACLWEEGERRPPRGLPLSRASGGFLSQNFARLGLLLLLRGVLHRRRLGAAASLRGEALRCSSARSSCRCTLLSCSVLADAALQVRRRRHHAARAWSPKPPPRVLCAQAARFASWIRHRVLKRWRVHPARCLPHRAPRGRPARAAARVGVRALGRDGRGGRLRGREDAASSSARKPQPRPRSGTCTRSSPRRCARRGLEAGDRGLGREARRDHARAASSRRARAGAWGEAMKDVSSPTSPARPSGRRGRRPPVHGEGCRRAAVSEHGKNWRRRARVGHRERDEANAGPSEATYASSTRSACSRRCSCARPSTRRSTAAKSINQQK